MKVHPNGGKCFTFTVADEAPELAFARMCQSVRRGSAILPGADHMMILEQPEGFGQLLTGLLTT